MCQEYFLENIHEQIYACKKFMLWKRITFICLLFHSILSMYIEQAIRVACQSCRVFEDSMVNKPTSKSRNRLFVCDADSVLLGGVFYGYLSLRHPYHITGTWCDFTRSRKRNQILPVSRLQPFTGCSGD